LHIPQVAFMGSIRATVLSPFWQRKRNVPRRNWR
jgi:hypothetical protein